MEVDRKRPSEGHVPDAKRSNVNASGPLTSDEIELFQKEAIFRQMNAYRRERDELQAQLTATESGDVSLRAELANLTEKYVVAAKQVERLNSGTLARIMNAGKLDDKSPNQGDSGATSPSGKPSVSSGVNQAESVDAKKLLELQSELAAAQGEISKLKEFMEKEDHTKLDLERQVRSLEEKIAANPVSADQAEMKIREAHAETQRLVIEASKLQQEITDLKGAQAEYEQRVRDKSAAHIAALERRVAAAEADVSRIRTARDELLSEVNVLKAESAEHRNETAKYKELAELADKSVVEPPKSSESTSETTATSVSEDLPSDADALRERCLSLGRQNKALIEEISGLEQGFARASAKAKAAVKATLVAEQKLGVLNTAKVRSDEKYIGAMRARDALSQELARTKQALTKSAEVVSDQKAVEQKLTSQISRLQKQIAQSEVVLRQRQNELELFRREKQEADRLLDSSQRVQEKLREQLAQRDMEKAAAITAKRTAETSIEKLQQQLNTQRAVSGLGSANDVQEQLESLRSIALCPVCQKNWKDRAIITCGHTLCADCVQSRLNARMRKCPMCNGHFASNDVLAIHL